MSLVVVEASFCFSLLSTSRRQFGTIVTIAAITISFLLRFLLHLPVSHSAIVSAETPLPILRVLTRRSYIPFSIFYYSNYLTYWVLNTVLTTTATTAISTMITSCPPTNDR
jgi:hypothetical protein